jgi:hypothetical protein
VVRLEPGLDEAATKAPGTFCRARLKLAGGCWPTSDFALPESEAYLQPAGWHASAGTSRLANAPTNFDPSMKKKWETIAQCLRAELADYGGLLNLFEEQQRSDRGRDPQSVLRFATRIESQARLVAQSRDRRQQAVAVFAGENGRPATASLRGMLSLIEPDARPLLKALITEVNLLLHRVRRASRHSHSLLTRAVEVHHETLQHLRPNGAAKPASASGRLALAVHGR